MADGLFTFDRKEIVEIPTNGPEYANDSTALNPLGCLMRYLGNTYRYVKHSPGTAVATVAGGVAYWAALAPASGTFTVSSDYTDSIAGTNGVAGFYGRHLDADASTYVPVTSGYYTWIQVGGVVAAYFKDSSPALGAKAFGYSTTDLMLDYVTVSATTTSHPIGIVISAEIATRTGYFSTRLENLDW
jgi:hypothetical protein